MCAPAGAPTVSGVNATRPAAVFRDRRDAGRRLAARLDRLRPEAPVVLALPRGGVPVAEEVARALGAPLDVLTVRKVGEPRSRFGAVAESGVAVIDHDEATRLGIGSGELSALRERALADVEEQARHFRGGRTPRDIVGRTVLLVDDGVGSGRSAMAAAHAARRRGAARIVLAVPVSGSAALARLGEVLDEVVCVEAAPATRWYEAAPPVSDAEIWASLAAQDEVAFETVELPGGATGRFFLPEAARGAIVLATRHAPVAQTLRDRGFATLELTAPTDTDTTGHFSAATAWLGRHPAAERMGLGLYGSGPAAAAALTAAAECDVQAVVAAGGRPDRAGSGPTVPALLVVGGEDRTVARAALQHLAGDAGQLAVVAGATHEFAEPGAVEQVAQLAAGWFARHL